MRVGIVTPRYPPVVAGGGEISVKLLADQLSPRVDDVTVFSFDGGSETEVDGVPVRRFRRLPYPIMEVANAYAAYALWRERDRVESLDLLHAYNVALHPAVGRISSLLGVPSVATLNSYDLLPKSSFGVTADPPRRLYELLAMPTTGRVLRHDVKLIDRFIALSRASRAVYRENGFESAAIDVVPNMLDPSFEVPDVAGDADTYQLLYVGSLIKEKGVTYLVRAMAELPDDVRLRIVGSGNRRSALEALTRKLDLSSRVEFAGHVPYGDLRRFYATADCFVHPGVWPEPFGRTILEAMQAALPVVTTDVGGPSEVVPQSELRCSPRSPGALATAIAAARRTDGVGASNREYAYERFAPPVVVSDLLGVYESAVGDR